MFSATAPPRASPPRIEKERAAMAVCSRSNPTLLLLLLLGLMVALAGGLGLTGSERSADSRCISIVSELVPPKRECLGSTMALLFGAEPQISD
ncbi:hypothetical protein BHE74_00029712 [Ensete ventricosum]|nr:hypothetical protein BHE74_00029712 [Ensete ventricosum]